MLSRAQSSFLRTPLPRITIVEGCISSGKTFTCNHKAMRHLVDNYQGDGLVFFIGKTIGTLEKNVLEPMAKEYKGFFSYNTSAKKANLCGIRIDLEGCNDKRAESKIRGTTAEFVYGDELTLWNRDFMVRCMGSLRTPKACFLGTTNPDTPTNFVKSDYLMRANELDLWNPRFRMDDNPSLTEAYKRQVDKEYMGVLHDRFIKGLWVRAEGIIYRAFADEPERFLFNTPPEDITLVNIGVDFGGNGSASVFCATGFTRGFRAVYVLDEEYRPAATESPDTLTKAFVEFCRRIKKLYPMCVDAYCDSAEQILIRGFRAALLRAGIAINVRNALKTETNDRIRLTGRLMGSGRLMISRRCTHLIGSLQNAVWDADELVDIRLDDGSYEVDPLDGFEYTIEPHAKLLVSVALEGG